ncbi:hypothetical protein V865_001664 [Kwoniella europaea PYCC6329]|uniref:Peptidase A1 domain-containing protein n=1 Tax=Kwoniella europaea PYCC6329 TaxID=1423913 RepID=A0AAX4KDP3_9TREE
MNITIDDRSPQIIYKTTTNSWYVDHTSNNLTSQYFDSTFYTSDGENDSATLEFNGTAIYVYGAKRDYHGTYGVQLDDDHLEELDGYSDDVLIQELLFKKEGLDNDKEHTITLTNLPSKTTHPRVSKGFSKWYLDIDHFVITVPNKVEEIVTTTIDDSSPYAQYVGTGWSNSTFGGGYYNNTAKINYGVGDSMSLKFTGTNIQVYGTINTDHGAYSISMDGNPAKMFDGYFFQARFSTVLYTATNLPEGEHTLVMQNAGGGKEGNGMEFDYAVVNSTKLSAGSGTGTSTGGGTNANSNGSSSNNTDNPANSDSDASSSSSSSSNVGAIAGGAVAGVICVLAIAALLWSFLFKKKNDHRRVNERQLIDLTGDEVKPYPGQNQNSPYYDSPPSHLGIPYTSSSVSGNSATNEGLIINTPANSTPFLAAIPAPPGSNASSFHMTQISHSQYASSSSDGNGDGSSTFAAPSANTFGRLPTASEGGQGHAQTLSPISENGGGGSSSNDAIGLGGRFGNGDTKNYLLFKIIIISRTIWISVKVQ